MASVFQCFFAILLVFFPAPLPPEEAAHPNLRSVHYYHMTCVVPLLTLQLYQFT